jgi:SAM-dependent methyltransferase
MSELGYDITGIEISKTRRNISKKLSSCNVLNLNLLSNEINHNKKYDKIVLFHVLEHISNPKLFLINIKKMMLPGGQIFVEVPNLDDFQLETNPNYKKWFWQRAHLSYFSKDLLQKLFRICEFKKIKIFGIQRYGIDNMINWQIRKKPQLLVSKKIIPDELDWLNIHYKHNLEKKLNSDTLFLIAQK